MIPKLHQASRARDLRPFETAMKIYTAVLCQRETATWRTPNLELGRLPGSPVLDALLTTSAFVDEESVARAYSVWFSFDIESAFDSVDHVAQGCRNRLLSILAWKLRGFCS